MTAPVQDQLTAGRVQRLVERELGLLVTPPLDATLESLGADSLDIVSLLIEVEKTFGVEIGQDEWGCCDTVGQITALVQAKTEGAAHA